ncbi:MAG TPA: response regulator [Burkholderiaceae bacterium]|nr:response regulator [Burkholderiaceae bacterium]
MSKTIMIIDDAPSVRQVVSLALKGAGYEVVEANDGRDAIAKLGTRKLGLIICDLNMPNLDGIGFLEHVKASPGHRFTPVIMLTTESAEDKKAAARAAGARAWITKPFQPSRMLEAVAKLCLP